MINRPPTRTIHGYVEIGRPKERRSQAAQKCILAATLGCFYAPTVFDDMRSEMRIAQEEIFGPVTGHHRSAGLEEALRSRERYRVRAVTIPVYSR